METHKTKQKQNKKVKWLMTSYDMESKVLIPEIIDSTKRDNLDSIQKRRVKLSEKGLWLRKDVLREIGRTKPTLINLEIILMGCLSDYEKYHNGDRAPLTDYHLWVLKQVSDFQNRKPPWKSLEEIACYVQRKAKSLSIREWEKDKRNQVNKTKK